MKKSKFNLDADSEAARFVDYLEDTLIPDLKDSGRVETAKDFETLVKFINGQHTVGGWNWNGQTGRRFKEYLEDTLIPDLKESGLDATAEDFEDGIRHVENHNRSNWKPSGPDYFKGYPSGYPVPGPPPSKMKILTLDQAEHWMKKGLCTEEEFLAYCHLWQTSAPRFSVQACHCVECEKEPRELGSHKGEDMAGATSQRMYDRGYKDGTLHRDAGMEALPKYGMGINGPDYAAGYEEAYTEGESTSEDEGEPNEDDITTEDHSNFYQDGKLVLQIPAAASKVQMWKALNRYMKERNFFPSVWFISDHGNAHLMTNETAEGNDGDDFDGVEEDDDECEGSVICVVKEHKGKSFRGEDGRQTWSEFCKKNKITMTAKPATHNPNMMPPGLPMDDWASEASHYECMLKHGKNKLTVYFSMGSAHTKPPEVEDVMNSLALDSSSADTDFESWASEFGYPTEIVDRYDEESVIAYKKAKHTYSTVVRYARKLHDFLGEMLYAEALYETEPL